MISSNRCCQWWEHVRIDQARVVEVCAIVRGGRAGDGPRPRAEARAGRRRQLGFVRSAVANSTPGCDTATGSDWEASRTAQRAQRWAGIWCSAAAKEGLSTTSGRGEGTRRRSGIRFPATCASSSTAGFHPSQLSMEHRSGIRVASLGLSKARGWGLRLGESWCGKRKLLPGLPEHVAAAVAFQGGSVRARALTPNCERATINSC